MSKSVYDLSTEVLHCIVDGSAGIYVPQLWAKSYKRGSWHGFNYVQDVKPLLTGPEHEHYWECWEDIINTAYFVDEKGTVWTLYQDGDLFIVDQGKIDEWQDETGLNFWENF